MRTLIMIIVSIFLMISVNTFAKDTNFSQDISTAIKSGDVSTKKIKENLCKNKTPKELVNEKYDEIFKKIGPALIKLQSEFHKHATKNAENLENKKFEIKGVKSQEIIDILIKYLKEDRNEILEKNTKLDSTYAVTITETIIKQVYIPNLVTAVEQVANEWLITEEKEHYIPFLKKKALQPKIIDRQKMMETISIEYLESRKEQAEKTYKCLRETSKIINEYNTGSTITISYDGENSFNYTTSLTSILNGFFIKKNVAKNKDNMRKLYIKVKKDVYNTIDNATNIE